MIEEAIFKEIQDDSTLSALLTEAGILNVFPTVIPANAGVTKAVVYNEIGVVPTFPLARYSLYQFDCFADTFADARAIAKGLATLFNDKKEWLMGGTFAVKYCSFNNSISDYNPDTKKYISIIEIKFKY